MIRKKLKHASGWALLGLWFLFGASCTGSQKAPADVAIRTMLDIIEMVCPPEITVGDCHARVRAWLPAESNPYVSRDGGAD